MQTKPKTNLIFAGTYEWSKTIIKAIDIALEGKPTLFVINKRHMQDWYFNKISGMCRCLVNPESIKIDAKNYIIKLNNGGSITFKTDTTQTADCNIIKDIK